MKKLRFILPVFVLLALFVSGAGAQTKTTKKSTAKKSTSTKTVPPLDVRAAREKVDVQLFNLNAFIDKIGTVAQNLETADADAKAGKLSAKTAASIESYKTRFVETLRTYKAPMVSLESEFRTKPVLKKYLPSIQGISDAMAEAEDLAIAGKFVASKDPLRQAAQKLMDTLAILPK